MYAAGRIPGSFFRREGRPSEGAILTCRLIDRPLRPCFVKGLRNEVQVVVTVMALNPNKTYDVVAINAASLSTQLAGLPFTGPIGGVRVALIGDQWVGFPDVDQLSECDLRHGRGRPGAGRRRRRDHDGRGRVHRADLGPGRRRQDRPDRGDRGRRSGGGQAVTSRRCATRRPSWPRKFPKTTAEFPIFLDYQDDVYEAVSAAATAELSPGHVDRRQAEPRGVHRDLKAKIVAQLAGQFEGREKEITGAYRALTKKLVRQKILTDKVRIDGRGLTDIRTLSAEVAVVPRVHGSALFQRGETQILGIIHAEHAGHGAEARHPGAGDHQALHAQLQLPALLHRRDRPGRLAEAARDRSRCARRAGPDAGAADPRGVPVRHPAGVRGARLQRLDLDGLGLRLHPGPAERRCAAARAGRRHRHGPGVRHRRRPDRVRGADRHPGRGGRVRRHGLQGRRHQDFITALQLDTKLDGIPASVLAGAEPGQGRPDHPARGDGRGHRRSRTR